MVSIVVLNYNGRKFLDRCLNSILHQNYPDFEVVFVDNASTDGSVKYVKDKFDHKIRLKIVENDKNYGPVEGNNIGIRHIGQHAKYVVLLNNDTALTDNWLETMVETMESDQKIGAACSKQLQMDDPTRLQGVGSFIDQYGFNYQLGEGEIDRGQYDRKTLEVFSAGTTALIIRIKLLKKIRLLDAEYSHGFDDVDFCWRVWLSGYKVVCVSRCTMFHKVAGTTKGVYLDYVVFHREKNRIMTAIKNYSVTSQFRILPFIFTFDLLQIIWFIFTRNSSMFWAIMRALTWNIKHSKYIWFQHLDVQYFIRKVSDKEVANHMQKTNLAELWRRIVALSI